MTSRQEAVAYFDKIGLPDFFKKIYSGELDQSHARIFAGCPEEYFMMTLGEQEAYSGGFLMPIIDDGNFDSVI